LLELCHVKSSRWSTLLGTMGVFVDLVGLV